MGKLSESPDQSSLKESAEENNFAATASYTLQAYACV